jgi:hypothetical protein
MTQISSKLSVAGTDDPIVHASWIARLAGASLSMARTAFDSAVTDERTRITNNGVGIYATGQRFEIVGELGYRKWFIGASAAASHALNVEIRSGLVVSLALDANTVTATSGTPSGGVDGDMKIDYANNSYYVKAAGTWGSAQTIFPGGGGTVAVTTGTFASLIATAGTQGQITVPTDATGLIRHTGVAGGAQQLSPTGTIQVIDLSAYTTGTHDVYIDGLAQFVHFKANVASTALINVHLPATATQYGQEITFACDYVNNGTFTLQYMVGASVVLAVIAEYSPVFKWIKDAATTGWHITALMLLYAGSGSPNYPGAAASVALLGIVNDSLGGIAIGLNSYVDQSTTHDGNCIAIGVNANTLNMSSIAIGPNSSTGAANCIAIGSGAAASGINSVAIGYGTSNIRDKAISIGTSSPQSDGEFLRTVNSYSVGEINLRGILSTTTATELSTNSAAVAGVRGTPPGNRWFFPNSGGNLLICEVDITGFINATKFYSAKKRFIVAVSAQTIVSSPVDLITPVVVGVTAPTITIGISSTNGAISVTVQLANTTDGSWTFSAHCSYWAH